MKTFRVLTLSFATLLPAQEGSVSFDLKHMSQPISANEVASVGAFVGLVAGGVFALIRRRKEETPKMRLND
jgi:hypothetical protein